MFVHGFYWQDKGKVGIEEEIEYCKERIEEYQERIENCKKWIEEYQVQIENCTTYTG